MSPGEKWTAEQIPDQAGRVAVVTGANSGIGLVTALELARAGAEVVLACRDTAKGEAAARSIHDEVSGASVSLEALDLSSLDSVRAFAERFAAGHGSLDLLINNAGRDGAATPKNGRRLRVAVRHQPPRPFRPDRALARQARGP